MFLTRAHLNLRAPRVRWALADVYSMHQAVMHLFPDGLAAADKGGRAQLGVLYRVEVNPRTGAPAILIQSERAPDPTPWQADFLDPQAAEAWSSKALNTWSNLEGQQIVAFRLRANPTKKITPKSPSDAEKARGRRVELRGETALRQWLDRKATQGGFKVVQAELGDPGDVRVIEEDRRSGKRGEQKMTFASVLFEGRLQITDPEVFRGTLKAGIGSAKSFGFGLLSIARAS